MASSHADNVGLIGLSFEISVSVQRNSPIKSVNCVLWFIQNNKNGLWTVAENVAVNFNG